MYLEYVFVGGGEEGYSTLDVMEFGGGAVPVAQNLQSEQVKKSLLGSGLGIYVGTWGCRWMGCVWLWLSIMHIHVYVCMYCIVCMLGGKYEDPNPEPWIDPKGELLYSNPG